MAKELGNKIGEFLEIDQDRDDLFWGESIRIKVLLDISKPLRRGFMLRAEEIEGDCWVTIRYERLPDFCFNCGRLDHLVKECIEKEDDTDMDMSNLEFGA